jgi:hypothetical protein
VDINYYSPVAVEEAKVIAETIKKGVILHNKVILITGATAGIGEATALHFAQTVSSAEKIRAVLALGNQHQSVFGGCFHVGVTWFNEITAALRNAHAAFFISFNFHFALQHHYLYPLGMGMRWDTHAFRHSKKS